MEQKDLIEEIIARVTAKMREQDEPAPNSAPCTQDARPGLLILTQEHGEVCHSIFDSQCLAKRYKIGCALLQDYNVNMDDYEVVVLFNLTNDAVGKLAAGIYDTPYTQLAAKAILMGKRLYVPVEQVELYRYAKTAPEPYYAMLQQKLALLTSSGLVISKMEDLEKCILDECTASCCEISNLSTSPAATVDAKEFRFCKHVITERDVAEACAAKAARIFIPAKSIVTDLARDFAHSRDISLIRE